MNMAEAGAPAATSAAPVEGMERPVPTVRPKRAGSRIGRAGRRFSRTVEGEQTFFRKHGLWILAAAGVLLLAGAGAAFVLMDRAKRREAIGIAVGNAESAYGKGKFEDAAKAANAAFAKLKAEGELLPADRRKAHQETIEAILADCKSLDEATASLRESKDPAGVKKAIEEKLAEASKSDRKKPLREALTELAKEADRRIEAARATRVKELLDSADRSYREGRFDEMEKALDEADSILASSPTQAADSVRLRIAEYRGYARMVREAEALFEKARQNDVEARDRLEKAFAEMAVTDEKKRPVRDRLQALVAKLPPKKSPDDAEKPPPFDVSAKESAEGDAIITDTSSLEQIGQVLARADYNISRYEGVDRERQGIRMSLGGRQVIIRFVKDGITFEADGFRALLPCNPRQMLLHISAPMVGILRMRDQLQTANLAPAAGGEWRIAVKTPFPEMAIVREDGDTATVFTRGRKYTAKLTQRDADEIQKANRAFVEAGSKLVEKIRGDAGTPEEIREVIAKVAESMYKPADQEDFLPMSFCRELLADGYLERNLPGGAAKFRAELEAMRAAYAELDRFHTFATGRNEAGDEFSGASNLNGRILWRFYDARENRTAFASRAPEDDTKMFVVTAFEGKHDSWPKEARPAEVAMSNGMTGPVARYFPATGELKVEEDGWKAAASLLHTPGRMPAWMGPPGWNFPPHVVVIDSSGRAAAIVTAKGRLDMPDFSSIVNEKARMEAHDAFVARMAEVLPDSGHLHLFFRYFYQYVLDSPVETAPNLLGNRQRCGDEHQTYHEFLDRKIAGRFCGDCDDLAEFYQVVTRKQGKLSFVVGVPGHAACGFVVKDDRGYNFYFLDTGPPRMFSDASLNKVLETGVRSYDREGNLIFDPESMQFLFRFAGEQTRTPYYLASRMFVDPQYAEIMERVQGYWHFHYYALGIETMSKMLETDKEAANFFELSGLYRSVCKFDKAVELMYEGMKHMKDRQPLSELNQYLHIVGLHKMARDKDKAFAV
ncbi:MAG: hypothetical protein N3A38_05750, partial [Planctomycetota bacterium]|nr:hypothetical protein [Planctomycetota bacterium]